MGEDYDYMSSRSKSNIFVSAKQSEEENSTLFRSKLALASRNHRRKLFNTALSEHYEPTVPPDSDESQVDGTSGYHTRTGLHVDEPCIYHSQAANAYDGSDLTNSPWTLEYCPGKSLTRMKLEPFALRRTGRHNISLRNIIINGKAYTITESHQLGTHFAQDEIMTMDEYYQEIFEELGEYPTVDNDSYYIRGEGCKLSTISHHVHMTSASIIHKTGSCCPNESNNHFQNQTTLSGEAILKVTAPSKCRYSVFLCDICEENNESEVDNDESGIDDEIEEEEEQSLSLLDFFLHLPDKDDPENTLSSDTIYASSFEELLDKKPNAFPPMPPSRVESNLKLLKKMFGHAYDSYMYNAYPSSELKPKSCDSGTFDLIRIPAMTLIDSLDTLIIMSNYTEFARSVERLRRLDYKMKAEAIWENLNQVGGIFAVDQNVSLFETNIRVLGGLLSAHQMAEAWTEHKVLTHDVIADNGKVLIGPVDAKEDLHTNSNEIFNGDVGNDDLMQNTEVSTCYGPVIQSFFRSQSCSTFEKNSLNSTQTNEQNVSLENYWAYDGVLLTLAHDIGRRLLPAFESRTGIPYGTVNLLSGVPYGETPIASLAGAGSLSIEMELLSRLTGDKSFGNAAKLATRALWLRRSEDKSLLGKHINIETGVWREVLSGVGSNSDSFYEYLLKHYILFPEDSDFFDMFKNSYQGIFNNAR